MTELDLRFRLLRVNLRHHGAVIADGILKRSHPNYITSKGEICIFCNSSSAITKEHVLPKWLFQNDTQSTFISSINKQTQTYNKAVLPTCTVCNNSTLGYIENSITRIVRDLATNDDGSKDDLYNIIRWLEIIEYKLQVLDCRRKFIKHVDSPYDPQWAVFPVAMMRHLMDLAPWKAYHWLRRAQRRITMKTKKECLNSLVALKTRVRHFDFFALPDQYIYISFPMYNLAFFYFLKRRFDHHEQAAEEALRIMKKVDET
jgi:hypothetical protein